MAGRNGNSLTSEKRRQFLDTLAETCNVSRAAKATGLTREVFYKYRQKDDAFAKAWQEATAVGADALEDHVTDRAFDPTDDKSHILAMFRLKALKPHLYKERHEHTGEGGGPMQVVISRQGDGED